MEYHFRTIPVGAIPRHHSKTMLVAEPFQYLEYHSRIIRVPFQHLKYHSRTIGDHSKASPILRVHTIPGPFQDLEYHSMASPILRVPFQDHSNSWSKGFCPNPCRFCIFYFQGCAFLFLGFCFFLHFPLYFFTWLCLAPTLEGCAFFTFRVVLFYIFSFYFFTWPCQAPTL